tara:strand:+ start:16287 stop:16772 length:486 start_codon:yes stop_codon:yes gene_type:complete
MKNLFTIGVYETNEIDFFNKLKNNNIDIFCDIRRRRGVRGAKYSFVNSLRLQEKLNEMNIEYLHFIEMSPSNEIREKQKQEDTKLKIDKRKRSVLGSTFINLYKKEHLNEKNISNFTNFLSNSSNKNIVLFCVEKDPLACHRSILTDYLENKNSKINIINL